MRVEKNHVVLFDYTLTSDDGEVIDTSEGHEPLAYVHGAGGIIPGLEKELDGKGVGDELKVSVAPEDGYGLRDDQLCQEVSREHFAGVDDLQLGMQFQVDSEAGPLVVTVIEIADETVTVDGNHPLAGVNLNFAVTIRDIREATQEEIDHGQANG